MTLLIASLIIFIAFCGNAMFGFGGGLISVPLLSLLWGVKKAVTIVLVFQFLLAFLLIKIHKSIRWDIARTVMLAIVIGSIIGAFSLNYFREKILLLILATAIILYFAKILFSNSHKLNNNFFSLFCGFTGSWFQGVVGTGGPLYVILLNDYKLKKNEFRASIIALFLIGNTIRMITYSYKGLFITDVNEKILFLLPIFCIAVFTGNKLHNIVSEKFYKNGVYLILTSLLFVVSSKF